MCGAASSWARADVLEKPLSSLKLRNIWQHVVRKVAHALPARLACTRMPVPNSQCTSVLGSAEPDAHGVCAKENMTPPLRSHAGRKLMGLLLMLFPLHAAQMMSSSGGDGKEALGCKPEGARVRLPAARGVSAPSSPRTPSPAASLLTIGSETATDKSCMGGDEASLLGCARAWQCQMFSSACRQHLNTFSVAMSCT